MSTAQTNCANCGQPLGEDGRCPSCGEAGHLWTLQSWRPLLQLALLIALGFSFTRLVVGNWDDERQQLASDDYKAGTAALDANQPGAAAGDFENALIYAHDNFEYQLKLTDALLASGATSEAVDQLHSFLEQRPADAEVNLKLARLEARRHHVDQALRYYLAAIDGDWPEHTDPFPLRIALRFESAEYLVEQGRLQEADWALQALAAVLPAAWPEQGKLADLFLRTGDAARALNAYQAELSLDRDNQAALLGAAAANLDMASYAGARRDLEAVKPPNDERTELTAQLRAMESLDPFAPGTPSRDRAGKTLAAFRVATARLERCRVPGWLPPAEAAGQPKPAPLPNTSTDKGAAAKIQEHWNVLRKWAAQLAPLMNERKLRDRDEVIESAMRFAFQAEIDADKQCGDASAEDEALLRLARARMGVGP